MMAEDLCHECKGTARTVFIDGSSYNIGNNNYSGWGIWSRSIDQNKETDPQHEKYQMGQSTLEEIKCYQGGSLLRGL
eukprot:10150825-Heterocapsa_arctica.AAC.1